MTEILQIYKCLICGNIVEVIHAGKGQLVCCGQEMKLQDEKTKEQGMEKHLPVTEKENNKIIIKVGSVPHPMEEKHYIEWISLETTNGIFRKFLSPNDKPEAVFEVSGDVIKVREYCNLHGLWGTK